MPRSIDRVVTGLLDDRPLRPGQREGIEAALAGDALVVLATGVGKTLVYRVVGEVRGGLTLVVSPTVALQHDQLRGLDARGPAAAVLNSSVGHERSVLRRATSGELGFLLLGPEQLAKTDVVAALAEADVRQVVVDEAHCVVGWGQDFRPDYLALPDAFAALGDPPVLGLTATASAEMRRAIAEALQLREPRTVVGEPDRPEIWLGAHVVADEDGADACAAELLAEIEPGQAAILYVATRRRAEELAARLGAAAYHGALPRRRREAVHEAFCDGSGPVVVATDAFGLGVDKPDVRLVVHVDPPQSLDALWQQTGRAGRDGKTARSVLLDRPAGYALPGILAGSRAVDVELLRQVWNATEAPTTCAELHRTTGLGPRRLRRAVNALLATGGLVQQAGELHRGRARGAVARALHADEDRRQRARSGVELVRHYAETTDCRRRLVLQLLGEDATDTCGHCDRCDAGTATALDGRDPLTVGVRVRHTQLGEGTVEQREADRVVILFDEGGYKTLGLSVLREHDLLHAAG